MKKACSSISRTTPLVLVGLLCGLTFAVGLSACSDTAPPPAVARPGSGGSKASGGAIGTGTGGTGGAEATGGSNAGGSPAAGGGPGAGGTVATDGPSPDVVVVIDTAPDMIPEEVLPPPDAPGCTNPCNTNRKRCSNDVVQDCVMVDNCPTWKDAVACSAPLVCTNTANSASCACPVTCVPGRKRCQNGMLEECTMVGACQEWKNATACPTPMTCMSANNTASCGCPTGPCNAGDKRCANGGLEECKAAGAGTCPNWQAAVACPTNKECTKPGNQTADCRCKPVCTMGQKKCDGASLSECVNVDGCPAWKTTACAAGQACAMAGNSASCGCPATACKIGDKICKGIGIVQECKATGAGGCGMYEETLCNNGRQCIAGPDSGGKKTASCNCPDGSCGQGDQHCDNQGVHQTCETSGGQCGKWVNDVCPTGKACTKNTTGNPAACGCPSDSCKVNSHKCSADNKTVILCSGECGQTTSLFEDCAAKGQVCKVDRCVAVVCTDDKKCDTEGAKRCTSEGGKNVGQTCQKTNDPVCPLLFKTIVTCDGSTPKCDATPAGPNPPAGPVCCPETACVPSCVVETSKTTFHSCKIVNGCSVLNKDVPCMDATPKCVDATKGCVAN
jgi:hypothetical protein